MRRANARAFARRIGLDRAKPARVSGFGRDFEPAFSTEPRNGEFAR